MPGWDSLATVARLHAVFDLAGFVLLVVLVAGGLAAYFGLRAGALPDQFRFVNVRLRGDVLAVVAAALLVLLIGAEAIAYAYGQRLHSLAAERDRERVDHLHRQGWDLQRLDKQTAELKRQARDAEERRAADLARADKRIVGLEQQLKAADEQFVQFQRSLGQRRLTKEEWQELVAVLKPFAGQKVTIASIDGDDESKRFADDFVAVLDDAGWDHNGKSGISVREFDRDPVGVEIMLNEADARADSIPAGIGALINVVRRLGLTRGNTIYMNGQVPSGQAEVRIGKKLRN